jgi:hypothetical protein
MADNQNLVVYGRVVYPHVLVSKWKDQRTGADTYSCRVLISKKDTATLKRLAQAIVANGRAQSMFEDLKFGKNMRVKGIRSDDHQPFKDGDLLDDKDHAGHYYIQCKTDKKLKKVVDGQMNPIIDDSVIYGGGYANVGIAVKTYNFRGTKGISWFLNGFQWVKGGPEISSGPAIEDMFGRVEGAEAVGEEGIEDGANPFDDLDEAGDYDDEADDYDDEEDDERDDSDRMLG